MHLLGADCFNIFHLCDDVNTKEKHEFKVNIPYYQRPYKWEEEQIRNLFHDFNKNKKEIGNTENTEYFLGSVVTVKNQETGWYDIIDGQQRITTVYLLNYMRFLMLRSHIRESITNKSGYFLERELDRLIRCSKIVFLQDKNCKLNAMKDEIMKLMKKISSLRDVDPQKEVKWKEVYQIYRKTMYLPEIDQTDKRAYLSEYQKLLYHFLKERELSLTYSRNTYNETLKEELSNVYIDVSKDKKPEIYNIKKEFGEKKTEKKYKYISAICNEFNILNESMENKKSEPLEYSEEMIKAIDNMLKNLKLCVVVTDNENDAYTLFEVLNDRALEVEDLDLIKNLFYKKYCLESGEDEKFIDQHIEELDELWGTKIFNGGPTEIKLISYLGTVYLTGNCNISLKENRIYRKVIESEYLDVHYKITENRYGYKNIFNDFKVFQMVKETLDEIKIGFTKTAEKVINAEGKEPVSITNRTFHLLHALNQDSVLPALMNVIIKTFIEKYVTDEIDINEYKKYLHKLMSDNYENEDEFALIHQCARILWKYSIMAKDYNKPREIAKKIIKRISFKNYEYEYLEDISDKDMKNDFCEWLINWNYKDSNTKNNLKIKVLFINLYSSRKENEKIIFTNSKKRFKSDKIELDHLEAESPQDTNKEKYFSPENEYEEREKYVNSIGNFMILDKENNIGKSNCPLCDSLEYHLKLGRHWLIDEIDAMMKDDKFSKEKTIVDKMIRVPKEEFFNERALRLQKYFLAMLERKNGEDEVTI